MRITLSGCSLVVGVAFLLNHGARAHAQQDLNEQARHIADLTNQDREFSNLRPLHWNDSLAAAAQDHAERMAAAGYLSHDYPGEPPLMQRAAQAGAHFQSIAENIATGYSDSGVESEWMHSTPHRTNILDPRMNAIGVGLVVSHGTLYAVEDFADASEVLTARQVEQRVGSLLQNEGIAPSAPRGAAALACSSNGGYPRGETGKLVVRFDTADLSQLPGGVVQQIRSGSYHSASVAACPVETQQSSFTNYRVAIVLY